MEITVEDLTRDFSITRRRRGLLGAFVDIFNIEAETKRAIDGLTFNVLEGQSVGYVGPNGSGKTTTVKILTGILVPTSGEVHCGHYVPWRNRVRYQKHIGVVFGNRPQMTPELTVVDHFAMLRLLYDVEKTRYRSQMDRLVGTMNIGPFLQRPVRELSLGQRMRCEIAAAFLHQPDIVFLDEPSIGIDAEAKRALRSLLRELNHDFGTTLFLISHDARDIEESCDRIIVINDGKIVIDGDIKQVLRDRGGLKRATMRVSQIRTQDLMRLREDLPTDADLSFHANTSKLEIVVPTPGSIRTEDALRCVRNLDIRVGEIHIQDADLEDVIIGLTQRETTFGETTYRETADGSDS
jgi:ABC-2 type transport system ATP-binding protein